MKTLTTTFIGFLLALTVSGMTTFEKNFIRNYREAGKTVRQTADGGYVIAAVSEFSHTYLIRTNPNGDTLWTKLYDGVSYDILEEMDGSFVMCGSLSGNASLRKVDANGAVLWTKSFGGTSEEVAYSLIKMGDGGFMFCGYTQSMGSVFQSVYCVRTDFAGDPLWEKFYSNLYVSEGVRIRELSGGNIMICGNATVISKAPAPNNILLIKINYTGDTLWTRNYVDGTGTLAMSFAETAGNGFLVCGSIGLLPSGNAVSLVNFDSDGAFQWSKIMNFSSNDSRANWIEKADDDNFIITGTADDNLIAFKADNAGDTLWTRWYNNSTIARGNCIQQTSDGGYVVCGQSGSSTTSFSTYLVKTDESGLITGTEPNKEPDLQISTYPNPAMGSLSIALGNCQFPVTISLYDLNGVSRLNQTTSGPETLTLDVSTLPAGVYLLKITNETGLVSVTKVVIAN